MTEYITFFEVPNFTSRMNGKDIYFSKNTNHWQYKGNNKKVRR